VEAKRSRLRESKDLSLIESLPNEILFLIFSYIPYKNANWLSMICTCKRFYDIGLQVFDPSVNKNYAIIWASSNGKLELVKRLLSVSKITSKLTQSRILV
jgi:hypothetical protein